MAQVILPRNAPDTIGGPIITAQMCCRWPRMGPVLQQKDAANALGWCKGVHSLKPDLGHLRSIADLLQPRPGFLQGCSFNEMRRWN